MIISGIIGFIIIKWKYPVAPLVIGLILGPMMENNLRKSLMMFDGDLLPILSRPISLAFLLAALLFIVYRLFRHYSR
jgi:putative tricarboxylic transport membrane protein